MKSFEIADEESEILREVLESYLKELGLELSRVDSIEFKHMLQHRREVVERIVEKVAGHVVPT